MPHSDLKTTTSPKLGLLVILFLVSSISFAQFVSVGAGSYTTTFPGTDIAGRNSFPSGTPQLSGSVTERPVPTNDWWSKLVKENHADNLFNYPFAMRTRNDGLVVNYIPWGVLGDLQSVVVGVSGLSESQATVSDYSDWTVTINWGDRFQATSGIGMPFLYFEKGSEEVAQVQINDGSVSVSGEVIIVTGANNGANYVIYAPTGSIWEQDGNVYTSDLNGNDYWSMAMLPQGQAEVNAIAEDYQRYAYVFPTYTSVNWNYNETNSTLRTDFEVIVDVKEGSDGDVLLGLLPHQWRHLSEDSPVPNGYTYTSVRGSLFTLAGNQFSTTYSFNGILPTLPHLPEETIEGYELEALTQKVDALKNDELSDWTDSYNEGQVMNRLIQTARIADKLGMTEARDLMIATVKERLEDWLTAEGGEIAFLFYYHPDWKALLGYPAGHGQDSNINDHHFHWGYFIHAAAFMEQFEPGWAAEWGPMVDLLVRDAASPNRDDSLFPFLRNFSPYGGHCWANGFATFPQGNDQESTSESMQFNSSLIHWGSITGDDEIRDLGIYLYTTEQAAVEEYWFDVHEEIFPDNPYSLVSRVWGNSYDNGTFWTADIAASYGIELYPIHGGSMYLGHDSRYAQKLWSEIEANTGILTHEENPNLWHDTMYKYLAFTDPEKAIELYNANPDRILKFGITDAQTYHWLHAMYALGKVNANVTADHPIAVTFTKGSDYTYVAHNYSNEPIDVTFSTGYVLSVPANSMATGQEEVIDETPPTNFTAEVGSVTQNSIELIVDGSDESGEVIYEVSYLSNTVSATAFDGDAQTFLIEDLDPNTSYSFEVTARDPSGNSAANSPITLSVTTLEEGVSTSCAGTDDEAQQGNFSVGYNYSFNTVGTDVTITFELLDEVDGLVAYLWRENPFGETAMTLITGSTYAATISDQVPGTTISYACKFAWAAGGLGVTRYFEYEVGDNCISEEDTAAPKNFVAETGTITTSSIELSINATDNSGDVTIGIAYSDDSETFTIASGSGLIHVVDGLSADTEYSFTITATDASGNVAANSPIVLQASTIAEEDTSAPTEFVAETGIITTSSIELSMNAEDDSGEVIFGISYPGVSEAITLSLGSGLVHLAEELEAGTEYSFTITASDASGNVASNSPITLTAQTEAEEPALNVDELNEIVLYPMPVTSDLHIEWEPFRSGTLYTLAGEKLLESSEQTWVLTDLANGTYLLILTGSNGQQLRMKVLKR